MMDGKMVTQIAYKGKAMEDVTSMKTDPSTFGPWMQVSNQRRKSTKDGKGTSKGKEVMINKVTTQKSCFEILTDVYMKDNRVKE